MAFDLCLHSGRSVETQRVDERVGFVIFFLPQRDPVIGDSKIAGDEALLPGTYLDMETVVPNVPEMSDWETELQQWVMERGIAGAVYSDRVFIEEQTLEVSEVVEM